jgi:hypothetical protein
VIHLLPGIGESRSLIALIRKQTTRRISQKLARTGIVAGAHFAYEGISAVMRWLDWCRSENCSCLGFRNSRSTRSTVLSSRFEVERIVDWCVRKRRRSGRKRQCWLWPASDPVRPKCPVISPDLKSPSKFGEFGRTSDRIVSSGHTDQVGPLRTEYLMQIWAG